MARIFSWCVQSVNGTCFSYLAKKSGSVYTTGYTVSDTKIGNETTLRNIANTVSGYTASEYQTQFENMKTAIASKPGFENVDWLDWSYYYDVSGDNLVMLTGVGIKGDTGIGLPGPQGEPGEPGRTGMAGNGRNIMVYCGLPSGLTPTRANVTGGKFYPNKWDIVYPSDTVGFPGTPIRCIWGDSNEYGSDMVVWMTNANFPSSQTSAKTESVLPIEREDNSGNTYTWSTPIQISGPKGDNGADGENIEFIYYRTTSRDEEFEPDRPLDSPQVPDYLPEVYVNGVDQGVKWTDHPKGISEEYKVEYMCTRTRDENRTWGAWSEVALWSSWGEDGNDGDGVEYIFAVTSGHDATEITRTLPNSGMTLALTNGGELVLADIWQDPEIYDYFSTCGVTRTNDGITVSPDGKYFFGKTGRTDNLHDSIYPWTDDPSDISENEPYEWVSIRKRKWVASEEKSKFEPFSEPKLWSHWGKNGEKGDDGTSLDLKIRKDTLGHLLQSLYNSSLPDKWNVPKNGYTYAIGSGDTTKMYVFMQLDDSVTGQSGYTKYQPPVNWELNDDAYLNYYWPYKESGVTIGYFWFSYCGLFKGEDGLSAYMHMKYGRDYKEEYGAIDHYTIEIEGKNVDICFTPSTPGSNVLGETPGPYMAVYCDNIYDDRGDLAFYCGIVEGSKNIWEKFRGDDGQSFGQEQIFIRGVSLGNKPPVRTVSVSGHGYEAGEEILDVYYNESQGCFTKVDWVPGGNYTDVPMGIVNGTYNFEWVCTRRLLKDGTWSYFSPPALYNEAADSASFQIEYSTWTGETTPVLQNASDYTSSDGTFDEARWRRAHSQYGPWSDVSSNNTVWMATAMYLNKNSNSATKEWSDWQITRCKGIVGKAGNGRNVVAYCIADSGYTVTRANISGGRFYPNSWTISFPTDPTGHVVWQDSNENSDSTKRVWMTNADFPSSTGTSESEVVDPIVKRDSSGNSYTWATPICITGNKGDNGADGESIEFIYYLAEDRAPEHKPDHPTDSPQEPDYLPWVYINGHRIGIRWSDNPQGISESKKVEYMCSRTRNEAGIWSEWSPVNMWSSWGEDGIDGDGVEYIFAVTKDLSQSSLNAIKAILPKSTDSGLTTHWQDPEIWDYIDSVPSLKSHYSQKTSVFSGWTDDPADVSPTEPYEWVSIRRKKYTSSIGDAMFYEFEEPTLWARWSDDGDEVHTSFAFTLKQEGVDISKFTVSGFETTHLTPTKTKNGSGQDVTSQFTWTDSPSAWSQSVMTASGAPIVWMVSGVFRKHHNAKTGQNTWTQEGSWSKPTRMVDTNNFETMYSSNDGSSLVDIRTISGFTKLGEKIDPAWEARANAQGWYDDAYDCPGGVIWMATITGSNGKFNDQDWQQFKVRGEKGDSGDSRHDLDYLQDMFGQKNVTQGPGAILKEFVGVTHGSNTASTIVAFINGSSGTSGCFMDNGHKIMIAAGANGLGNVHNANFRVYDNGDVYANNGYFKGEIYADSGVFNGTVYANDGKFSGEIKARSGDIGGIEINNNGLSSENGNFLLDSGGNLSVASINIDTENFVLGTNEYGYVGSFTGTTGHNINSSVTLDTVIFSASSQQVTTDMIQFDNITFNENTLFTYTIDAKQRVTFNITYEVYTQVDFTNGITWEEDYAYPYVVYDVDINTSVGDGFSLHNNTNFGRVDYNNKVKSLTISGVSSFVVNSHDSGTYNFKVSHGDFNNFVFGYSSDRLGKSWRVSQLQFKIKKVEVNGIVLNVGTEIFKNGIGIKNDGNNYFFVNRTSYGSNFNVHAGGAGIDLDTNGIDISAKLKHPLSMSVTTFGGSTKTLDFSNCLNIQTGSSNTIVTLPSGAKEGWHTKVVVCGSGKLKFKSAEGSLTRYSTAGDNEMTYQNYENPSSTWISGQGHFIEIYRGPNGYYLFEMY